MIEIGGYFELELDKRKEFHHKALRLNSGRSLFEYILISKSIKKIYLPFYICDSVLEPIKRNNIQYEFYEINENFEIASNIQIRNGEKLLYVKVVYN